MTPWGSQAAHAAPLSWFQVQLGQPLSTADAAGLLDRILADRHLGRVVLETRASGGRARTLVATRPGASLEATIPELVPGSRVTTSAEDRQSVDAALRLKVSRPLLPLNTERIETVVRAVLAAMAATGAGEELVIQAMIGPRYRPSLSSGQLTRSGWMELLGFAHPVQEPRLSAAIRRREGQHQAGVMLRLGARAATPARWRALLSGLLGALRMSEGAGVRLRACDEQPERLTQARRPWRYPLALSAHELACLIGWPIGAGELPATPGAHPRRLALPEHRDTTRVFATGVDEHRPGRLGISIHDALFHTVLLGPTGAGKSTAMAQLALADIQAGRGVLLIDPKADLVHDLLARIPPERHDDVVVIDPTSPTPVGINPLATTTGSPTSMRRGRRPELIADAVLATFKTLFADSWGPRTEEILTAGLLTLARTPGATLVDLPLLLTSPAHRRRITTAAPDPLGTDRFWAKYEALPEAQRSQWIAPVLNKLQPFLIRPHLRATLGQATPRFDLAELLTRRRIVLVSLNKGVLGAESARLLGSLLIGQLWPLILARAALPPERRHIVSLYIDEVQDYLALPGDLADALAQARSLGAAFHLAHQYRAQLPPALRAGIDTNARNKIIFSLSASDATEMARQATGVEPADFQLLPRFGIYTQTLHRGQAQPWAMATTMPLPPPTTDPVELHVASTARYGRDAPEVEAQLLERLGLTPHTTAGPAPPTGAVSGAETIIGRRPRKATSRPDSGI
ncbi:type IV secretory system conjugative DNA transfer family protein [Actinomyces bowdenii]|uniref:type IV secretory system conjugative DNA transfer family protein n=1 Tax=Actinomyces bowdenii TaxID=131109 RepID=UPI001ABCCD32|nr:type IV secretory system conjugative DNA transfer family protein [Actinomyces bowdenii]MBO3724182.1 type IV secretory system conjugative DNA transfer family protein [Actinomyces bowdenii]